jgi:hypothetical protein
VNEDVVDVGDKVDDEVLVGGDVDVEDEVALAVDVGGEVESANVALAVDGDLSSEVVVICTGCRRRNSDEEVVSEVPFGHEPDRQ